MSETVPIEDQLITAAREILAGGYEIPPERETRAAALLARTALEAAVNRRVSELSGVQIDSTNMRHQLICLRYLPGGDPRTPAAWIFAALSSACHEHAYDLAPTHHEMEHLTAAVADFIQERQPTAVP